MNIKVSPPVKIQNQIIYQPSMFGYKNLDHLTGKGIKICLIDSGKPENKNIKNIKEFANMTEDSSEDFLGHATAVSGLLTNNDSHLIGMCPNAELYLVKAIKDNGYSKINSIIAGILWGIIKKVDIIFFSLSTDQNDIVLENSIKKAYENNISIITSTPSDKELIYPSKYKNVITVGSLNHKNRKSNFSTKGKLNIIGENVLTSFKNNTYNYISGSSISAAIATGIMCRIIENKKDFKQNYKDLLGIT